MNQSPLQAFLKDSNLKKDLNIISHEMERESFLPLIGPWILPYVRKKLQASVVHNG